MNGEFMWRCARCSNHFANITKTEGIIKQEKKCPKCKWVNIITLSDKEIHIHCRQSDAPQENYYEDAGRFPIMQ